MSTQIANTGRSMSYEGCAFGAIHLPENIGLEVEVEEEFPGYK